MFELKSYSRKELAILYFPDVSARAAYMSLHRLLVEKKHKCPELYDELYQRKVLTKSMVRQIVELLGEP